MGPKESDYTCVTFEPDLARFKMDSLDDATVGLLSKRAYDVAGCASGFPGKTLKVYLNSQRLPLNSFQDVSSISDAPVWPIILHINLTAGVCMLMPAHTFTVSQALQGSRASCGI